LRKGRLSLRVSDSLFSCSSVRTIITLT
jgi:hypothetical protein